MKRALLTILTFGCAFGSAFASVDNYFGNVNSLQDVYGGEKVFEQNYANTQSNAEIDEHYVYRASQKEENDIFGTSESEGGLMSDDNIDERMLGGPPDPINPGEGGNDPTLAPVGDETIPMLLFSFALIARKMRIARKFKIVVRKFKTTKSRRMAYEN